MEYTDLYRPLGTGIKSLDPQTLSYAGAMIPVFLLVHDDARPHVLRVCRQFLEDEGIDTINWHPRLLGLNLVEQLGDIVSVHPAGIISDDSV